MSQSPNLKFTTQCLYFSCLFLSFFLLLVFAQAAFAQGVFQDKKKASHTLKGVDLNRIKAEHQLKFGSSKSSGRSYNSNNPWEKKKKKARKPVNKANWGECRDYALYKRNRCYREGQDAYRCEQMYEARSHLCDNEL